MGFNLFRICQPNGQETQLETTKCKDIFVPLSDDEVTMDSTSCSSSEEEIFVDDNCTIPPLVTALSCSTSQETTVSFSPIVHTREVPSLSSFSAEEKARLWSTPEDLLAYRKETSLTVELLNRILSTIYRKGHLEVQDDERHTFLGLDCFSDWGRAHRQDQQKTAWRSVFAEQHIQRITGNTFGHCKSSEKTAILIARNYQRHSPTAHKSAHIRALKNAASIAIYLQETDH